MAPNPVAAWWYPGDMEPCSADRETWLEICAATEFKFGVKSSRDIAARLPSSSNIQDPQHQRGAGRRRAGWCCAC